SNYFRSLGLESGDIIALIHENSPDYIFITVGINKIQGISALINSNQRKKALVHAIEIVSPKWIIIGDERFLEFFDEIVEELSIEKENIFVVKNSEKNTHNYIDLSEKLKLSSQKNPPTTYNSKLADTAEYIYTSGTTGLPKAVIILNWAFPFNGLYYGSCFAHLDSNDIIYSVTPLYHSLGQCTAWGNVAYAGSTFVLAKRFSVSNYWKDIHKYNVSVAFYIGEIPRYLLNRPPSDQDKNHTLKKLIGLGLRKEIWEEFQSRFNIEHIYEYYSSTEGFGPLVNFDEVPGMIGRNTNPNSAIAKVDAESGELLKNDEGFMIRCISGDIGMSLLKIEDVENYTKYRDNEKTKQRLIQNVFEPGDAYFKTFDFLKVHDDHWVSFADRFGDTFRWKGENVSTLEVENILDTHEMVLSSAVYGVPIPKTEGKAGMASLMVESASKIDIDSISRFVSDSLPKYSVPVFLRIRETLALTGSYKITKVGLKREEYDVEKITDPLYCWDASNKIYIPFNSDLYEQLKAGKLKF
ncbi:MAG TPA: long-chain-acyl-CoA synthetase, partial [bacterium]|nr:long-chain-acyl-CoA synthetase [bacterium]